MHSKIKIIDTLLTSWSQILINGKENSLKRVKRIRARKKRIEKANNPVIFDRKSFITQRKIQNELSKILPELKELINSKPLLENYEWDNIDYIDLYYNHYEIVIEKIKGIISDKLHQ